MIVVCGEALFDVFLEESADSGRSRPRRCPGCTDAAPTCRA
jgi:hypothetical protein